MFAKDIARQGDYVSLDDGQPRGSQVRVLNLDRVLSIPSLISPYRKHRAVIPENNLLAQASWSTFHSFAFITSTESCCSSET